MFQLLQPIWLLALAGVLIPLIIHLWNIKPGKTLKVGSIAFLTLNSRQNARSLRLNELLLLLLRCILIGLLSILIAKPQWQQQEDNSKVKGWLLIEPGKTAEIYAEFKERFDSLMDKGYELHYFEEGFKKKDLATLLENNIDTVIEKVDSYWLLLRQLEQAIPAALPVQLFTGNRLSKFSGTRPETSLRLTWQSYHSTDTPFTGIQYAYLTNKDSICLVQYQSNSTGSSYKRRFVSATGQRDTGYSLHIDSGNIMVADMLSAAKRQNEVPVDTSTLNITIFTDNYVSDAGYLKSALNAIQQYTSRKINITFLSKSSKLPEGQQWLFWLSETPVDKSATARNIFRYVKGRPVSLNSTIIFVRTATQGAQIPIYKSVPSRVLINNPTEECWRDGFGNPVLLRAALAGNVTYDFFSRFDPEWNDLVWSESFPAVMMDLILGSIAYPLADADMDRRAIDQQQLLPAKGNKMTSILVSSQSKLDISWIFWVAAFIIFLTERIVSFNSKKKALNG